VSKKRATESTSQDGLGMLRRGLKRRASTLPDLDVEYVSAALTILRTALEVRNYYAEGLLRQVGLTPARLNLLMALFLCGDRSLRASELGELLVVSPGNITGLVDGLVKDRLVHRGPSGCRSRAHGERVPPCALARTASLPADSLADVGTQQASGAVARKAVG